MMIEISNGVETMKLRMKKGSTVEDAFKKARKTVLGRSILEIHDINSDKRVELMNTK